MLVFLNFQATVPRSLTTYLVYEFLDVVWQKPKYKLHPLESMLQGLLVGGFGMALAYPFEVIKRKMQVGLSNENIIVLTINNYVDSKN